MSRSVLGMAGWLIAQALVVLACSSSGGEAPADAAVIDPTCGRLKTPCTAGGACEGAADCASSNCREGICKDVVPSDGKPNGTETDVDCGGPTASACDDGKKCVVVADCRSGVCTGICQPPRPDDGVKNGDETDRDCGGAKASKCSPAQGCSVDGDCQNVRCDQASKRCSQPSADDGLRNRDETGVDCGGPTTPRKCPPGQGCAGDGDCNATRCGVTARTCDPPTATDGLLNGGESDVDCGGAPTGATQAPACIEGKTCKVDGDCADPYCSFDKKCVTGRSCTGAVASATSGIVTCGPLGGVTESCCRSLPLPVSTTVRLDKYEVTSGRFRQFIETVGPNVRQWVTTQIAERTPAGNRLAEDVPAELRGFYPASATPGEALNLLTQLGGTVMDGRRPSVSQGCYNGLDDSGHNTYWFPATTLQAHFSDHPGRRHTQAEYDAKSMNCSPYWMYAAFCAWDGGRMPTTAEITQVWTAEYPWGAGYGGAGRPVAPAGGIPYATTVNRNNVSLFFYQYPGVPNGRDTVSLIASPGHFLLDATTVKSNGQSWQDLGANVMEMVKITTGSENFCDHNVGPGETTNPACTYDSFGDTRRGVLRATSVPKVPWVGGSWEVHDIARVYGTFGAQTQYGKAGFRCAR